VNKKNETYNADEAQRRFDRWIVGRIARSIPAMTLLTGGLANLSFPAR
jgi:hypothetical protein